MSKARQSLDKPLTIYDKLSPSKIPGRYETILTTLEEIQEN